MRRHIIIPGEIDYHIDRSFLMHNIIAGVLIFITIILPLLTLHVYSDFKLRLLIEGGVIVYIDPFNVYMVG